MNCIRRAGCTCPGCNVDNQAFRSNQTAARTPMRSSFGEAQATVRNDHNATAAVVQQADSDPDPEAADVEASADASAAAEVVVPAAAGRSSLSFVNLGPVSSALSAGVRPSRKSGIFARPPMQPAQINSSPPAGVSELDIALAQAELQEQSVHISAAVPASSTQAKVEQELPWDNTAGSGSGNARYTFSSEGEFPAAMPGGMLASTRDVLSSAQSGADATPASLAPFLKRWADKSPNVRRQAITELITALRAPGCPITPDMASVIRMDTVMALIGDSAQLISEAGVQLAGAMVQAGPVQMGIPAFLQDESMAMQLIKAVVAKGFASAKTPVADAAVEAVVGTVAVCSTGISCALEELTGALKAMAKPKAVRNAARALTRLILDGKLKPSVKPELLVNPALLNVLLCTQDKSVASAGLELAKALAGAPLPFMKALEQLFEGKWDSDRISPELLKAVKEALEADRASASVAGSADGQSTRGEGSGGMRGVPANSDPLESEWAELDYLLTGTEPAKDLKGAVAALKLEDKMAPNAEDKVTKEKLKWGDRVKALEELIAILGKHPRVAGDSKDYADAVNGLRKALKDVNVNVQAKAVEALRMFSSRLKDRFTTAAKSMLVEVVSKLRQKGGSSLTAAVSCLRTFVRFDTVSVEDVMMQAQAGEEAWKKSTPEFRKAMLTLLLVILNPAGTGLSKHQPLTGTSATVAPRLRGILSVIQAGLSDPSAEIKVEAERALAVTILRCSTETQPGSALPDIKALLDAYEKENKVGSERVRDMVAGKVSWQPTSAHGTDRAQAVQGQLGETAAAGGFASTAAAFGSESARPPLAPAATGRFGRSVPLSSTGTVSSGASGSGTGRPPAGVGKFGSTASAGAAGKASSSASGPTTVAESAYAASIAEEGGSLPSYEEAEAAVAGGLVGHAAEAGLAYTPEVHKLHDSKQWSERKQALEALIAAVLSSRQGVGAWVEAVVAFLHAKLGKWSSTGGLTNTTLLVAVAVQLEKLVLACTSPTHFSRRAARNVLDGLLPYLKERKGSSDVASLACALAWACGPNFVAARLVAAANAEKAGPALLTAVNECLITLIERFGVGRLTPAPLLPHLCGPAGAQAAGLPKGPAIKALHALHAQMGDGLTRLVFAQKSAKELAEEKEKDKGVVSVNRWGMNVPLVNSLTESFKTQPYSPEAAAKILEATKAVLGETAAPVYAPVGGSASAGGGLAPAAAGHAEGGIFGGSVGERVDLLSVLPSGCLDDMDRLDVKDQPARDGDVRPWQVRMGAVDTVSKALTGLLAEPGAVPGACLLVNDNTTLLLKALKKRLGDQQANIKPKACAAISAAARAAGPTLAPVACKTVVPALLEMLSDKKSGLKDAAVAALDAIIAAEVAPDGTVQGMNAAAFVALLGVAPPSLGFGSLGAGGAGVGVVGAVREVLVPWLATYMPYLPKSSSATSACALLMGPILDCLSDRLPTVREAAQVVLVHLARIVGQQPLMGALVGMKESEKARLTPLVEAAVASSKGLAPPVIKAVPPPASAPPAAAEPLKATTAARPAFGVTAKAGAAKPPSLPAAPALPAESYWAIHKTAPTGRQAREKDFSAKQWALDITPGKEELLKLRAHVSDQIRKSNLFSPKYFSELFPEVDKGPQPLVKAVDWLTSQVHAALDPGAADTLEALRCGSDMLCKLAMFLILEANGKRDVLSCAGRLVDSLLRVYETQSQVQGQGHAAWKLEKYEGDILMPTLARYADVLDINISGRQSVGVSLLHRAVMLLQADYLAYQTNGHNKQGQSDVDAYASITEHYFFRSLFTASMDDPRALLAQSSKVSPASVLATALCVSTRPGASSRLKTVRQRTAAALARVYDFTKGQDAIKAAIVDLFTDLYVAAGGGGSISGSDANTHAWATVHTLILAAGQPPRGASAGCKAVSSTALAALRKEVEKRASSRVGVPAKTAAWLVQAQAEAEGEDAQEGQAAESGLSRSTVQSAESLDENSVDLDGLAVHDGHDRGDDMPVEPAVMQAGSGRAGKGDKLDSRPATAAPVPRTHAAPSGVCSVWADLNPDATFPARQREELHSRWYDALEDRASDALLEAITACDCAAEGRLKQALVKKAVAALKEVHDKFFKLTMTVTEPSKLASEDEWQLEGKRYVVDEQTGGTQTQVVYEGTARLLRRAVQDLMASIAHVTLCTTGALAGTPCCVSSVHPRPTEPCQLTPLWALLRQTTSLMRLVLHEEAMAHALCDETIRDVLYAAASVPCADPSAGQPVVSDLLGGAIITDRHWAAVYVQVVPRRVVARCNRALAMVHILDLLAQVLSWTPTTAAEACPLHPVAVESFCLMLVSATGVDAATANEKNQMARAGEEGCIISTEDMHALMRAYIRAMDGPVCAARCYRYLCAAAAGKDSATDFNVQSGLAQALQGLSKRAVPVCESLTSAQRQPIASACSAVLVSFALLTAQHGLALHSYLTPLGCTASTQYEAPIDLEKGTVCLTSELDVVTTLAQQGGGECMGSLVRSLYHLHLATMILYSLPPTSPAPHSMEQALAALEPLPWSSVYTADKRGSGRILMWQTSPTSATSSVTASGRKAAAGGGTSKKGKAQEMRLPRAWTTPPHVEFTGAVAAAAEAHGTVRVRHAAALRVQAVRAEKAGSSSRQAGKYSTMKKVQSSMSRVEGLEEGGGRVLFGSTDGTGGAGLGDTHTSMASSIANLGIVLEEGEGGGGEEEHAPLEVTGDAGRSGKQAGSASRSSLEGVKSAVSGVLSSSASLLSSVVAGALPLPFGRPATAPVMRSPARAAAGTASAAATPVRSSPRTQAKARVQGQPVQPMARTPTGGGAPRTQARTATAQAAAGNSAIPVTPASSAIPKPAVYPPVPSSLARASQLHGTALTLSELITSAAKTGGKEGSPKTAARVYPPLPTERDVPPAPSHSLRGAGHALGASSLHTIMSMSSTSMALGHTMAGPALPSKEWTIEEVLAAVRAEPRKDVAEGELAPKTCTFTESPSAITCAGRVPMDIKVALTPYVTWLRGKTEEPAEGFEPLAEVLLTHSSPLHQIMLPTSSWRSVPDLARLCPPTAFILTATKLYDALFDLHGNPVTPFVLEPAQALKVTRLVTALSALGGKNGSGSSRYRHAPRLPLTVMCKVLNLKTKEAKSSLGADASKSRLIGNGTLSVVGGSRLAFTFAGGAVPATPLHATGALAIGSALRPPTGAPPALFAAALGTPAGKGAAQGVVVPASAAAATPVSAGVGPKGAKRLSGGLPPQPAFPGMAASNTAGTPAGISRPLGTIDTSSRANAIPYLPAGSSSGSGGSATCDSPGRTGSTGTGSTCDSPVSVTI